MHDFASFSHTSPSLLKFIIDTQIARFLLYFFAAQAQYFNGRWEFRHKSHNELMYAKRFKSCVDSPPVLRFSMQSISIEALWKKGKNCRFFARYSQWHNK